jgi:hypothetical protein
MGPYTINNVWKCNEKNMTSPDNWKIARATQNKQTKKTMTQRKFFIHL